jgi:hypothetical protein
MLQFSKYCRRRNGGKMAISAQITAIWAEKMIITIVMLNKKNDKVNDNDKR